MRKNQKYSREQMYQAIEKWQASGLSQHQFCSNEKLAKATFSYWLKKYKKEQGPTKPFAPKPLKTFIPLEVSKTTKSQVLDIGQIEITYPNGVKVSCPAGIDMQQLKTLINI